MTNHEKYRDLFIEQKFRIMDMINIGSIHSMKEIDDKVHDLYMNTSLNAVYTDYNYGTKSMIRDLYSSYIIHCEVVKQIPVSGY